MGNNNNKKSAIILTIANNERFKEKIKKYSLLFDKIREEKNKSFQISCKKFKNDENYEFNRETFLFKSFARSKRVTGKK